MIFSDCFFDLILIFLAYVHFCCSFRKINGQFRTVLINALNLSSVVYPLAYFSTQTHCNQCNSMEQTLELPHWMSTVYPRAVKEG